MADFVNHPDHYATGDVECIDAIRSALGPELFCGYLWGNALKYLWRWPRKGLAEDLEKCQWYLNRIVSEGFTEPAKMDVSTGCMIPNDVLSLVNSGNSADVPRWQMAEYAHNT